jgi:hypothetical protein
LNHKKRTFYNSDAIVMRKLDREILRFLESSGKDQVMICASGQPAAEVGHQRGRTTGCGAGTLLAAQCGRGIGWPFMTIFLRAARPADNWHATSLTSPPYDGIANESQDF